MTLHYAINPAPFRERAVARRDDPEATRKEKALAETLIVMCDRYDELRDVLGVQVGQVVRPGHQDYARNDDGTYMTPEQTDEGWAVQ